MMLYKLALSEAPRGGGRDVDTSPRYADIHVYLRDKMVTTGDLIKKVEPRHVALWTL